MISDPLNGMFWDIGIDFQIPYFGDTEKVSSAMTFFQGKRNETFPERFTIVS